MVETARDREEWRCLESRSSREHAVSADEEFCIQIHALGWSLLQSPSKSSLITMNVSGEIVKRYLNDLNDLLIN